MKLAELECNHGQRRISRIRYTGNKGMEF
jgi:hypothetical protein